MSTTTAPTLPVSLADIQAAARRLESSGLVKRTPVMTSRGFDERAGAKVFFKCENLQTGGAFKIRGATNFLVSLSEEQRARGVVAFSSGNHAQGVAIAAQALNVAATLVMPVDAPQSKVQAAADRGARIVRYDRFKEDRAAIANLLVKESGAMLVPPFDHPWIIAGAGTTALELMDQAGPLDALVVCIGGGGLISGCAIAAKQLQPGIRIYGVEPADANDTYLSRQAGKRVEIAPPATIADGLRAQTPGELTFPVIRQLVDDIVLVSEDEIRETIRYMLARLKILLEPSGAVSAAAVLNKKIPPAARVGVVISGGNVDLDFLKTLL